jgi:hypothetical protein
MALKTGEANFGNEVRLSRFMGLPASASAGGGEKD